MGIFLLLAVILQVYGQQEFTVPLLGYGVTDETYDVKVLYQFVNPGPEDATAWLEDGTSVTVNADSATYRTLTVNETQLPTQSQIMNLTRSIITSFDIDLQVITTINGHSEGVQAIPNAELGTEYYVSTSCDFGGYCQMVIASTFPGTTLVYVKLPAAVDEVGFCIVNGTWYSSSDTTITLEYPEVVQIETTHDLTGTWIYANDTVAVTVGSRSKTGSTPMFHLVEQLVPVPEWGTEYLVRAMGTTTYGNIVHITSHKRRTYVTMDGFPTVELTGSGQTVKRRIEKESAIRIKATRPVQVMLYVGFTYWTNETITNPGMTLVPAVEHFRSPYRLACERNLTSDVVQVVTQTGSTVSVPTLTSSATVKVPYSDYSFEEFNPPPIRADPYDGDTITVNSGAAAIMTCKNSAIFPVSRLIKQNTGGCPSTLSSEAFPADGEDNDCAYGIDNEYCFENKMLATAYSVVNKTFLEDPPEIVVINNFHVIKLRLRTCGDVKVELHGEELVEGSGKFVISIARERFVIYSCFPNCSAKGYRDTTSELGQTDCNTLIPYWIVRTASELCMDVGSFPDFTCGQTATVLPVGTLQYNITEMFLYGLHSNAVFYYDVYRRDCGGLYSDWRCEDKISNCWEYDDDLCSNAAYVTWVATYCAKFCGVCSPDSAGKMFALIAPSNETLTMDFTLIPGVTSDTLHASVMNNVAAHPFSAISATTKAGDPVNVWFSSVTPTLGIDRLVQVVYTNTSAHLTVTAALAGDAISIPVFPLDALGTEYMTLSFTNNLTCDVISAEGAVDVWKSTASATTYIGSVYPHATIQLNPADTVGTVISASRPVAVFCSYIDSAHPADNYWVQLMPTSSWGTMYILPALNATSPSTAFTATARILANRANTRVEISGDFQAVFILDERGDYIDQAVDPGENYNITSNTPVAVAVMYTETITGAKSVLTPPAVDNYMNSAVIYLGNVDGRVDFSVVKNDSSYTTEWADAGASSKLCYETQTNGTFAMSIYKNFSVVTGGGEMYNHPVHQSGHLVNDLYQAAICRITVGTPGDGVDNDCDGLIDEENTFVSGYGSYNVDDDGDGAMGEDCLTSAPLSPAVDPPEIPVCLEVVIPSNLTYCATRCQCPCWWRDAYVAYNNMSQEEKDASNFDKIIQYVNILKIDPTILTATVAEKESAEDERTSSANIGLVGIALLTLTCALIVFFDMINVVRYFRAKRRTSAETD